MNRNEVWIKGAEILLQLFEKYKNEPWVLSTSEIAKKNKSWFSKSRWKAEENNRFIYNELKYGLECGITITDDSYVFFLHDRYVNGRLSLPPTDRLLSLYKLEAIEKEIKIINATSIKILNPYFGKEYILKISKFEIQFLEEFFNNCNYAIDKKMEEIQNKEKKELELFKKSKVAFLQNFDKNDNGIVDVIEGVDEFMTLFKKHQNKVIEADKKFILNFVKIANNLKTKRQNIQDIFLNLKNSNDYLQLDENVKILKNHIHTYELLLFHSLNMLISIVDDDLITFYEIYELFDKLNIFNSNWENEVSQELKNIGDGLNELMYSIDSMENNIINGLSKLTYVTQKGFSNLENSVTKELNSINSSIKYNNLLTGISTYQLYKIKKYKLS